jgi:hypothetical protein
MVPRRYEPKKKIEIAKPLKELDEEAAVVTFKESSN